MPVDREKYLAISPGTEIKNQKTSMAPVASCSGRATASSMMLPQQQQQQRRHAARKPPPAMPLAAKLAPSSRILEPLVAASKDASSCSTSRCVWKEMEKRQTRRAMGGRLLYLEKKKKVLFAVSMEVFAFCFPLLRLLFAPFRLKAARFPVEHIAALC